MNVLVPIAMWGTLITVLLAVVAGFLVIISMIRNAQKERRDPNILAGLGRGAFSQFVAELERGMRLQQDVIDHDERFIKLHAHQLACIEQSRQLYARIIEMVIGMRQEAEAILQSSREGQIQISAEVTEPPSGHTGAQPSPDTEESTSPESTRSNLQSER